MKPSRCLPDPKGSMSVPSQTIAEANKEVQKAMQATKRGPYLQLSVRNRAKYAGHRGAAAAARHYTRDNEQSRETILGRWPMVFPSFFSATAYLSSTFRDCPPDCLVNVVATNAQILSILVVHDIVGSTCDSEPARALASSNVIVRPDKLRF